MALELGRLGPRLDRKSGAIDLDDFAMLVERAGGDAAHVVPVEIAFGKHPRCHVRQLRGRRTAARRPAHFKIDQQIGRALLQPGVVVVRDRLAQQPAILRRSR